MCQGGSWVRSQEAQVLPCHFPLSWDTLFTQHPSVQFHKEHILERKTQVYLLGVLTKTGPPLGTEQSCLPKRFVAPTSDTFRACQRRCHCKVRAGLGKRPGVHFFTQRDSPFLLSQELTYRKQTEKRIVSVWLSPGISLELSEFLLFRASL